MPTKQTGPRLHRHFNVRIIERREVDYSSGSTSEQTVEFTGAVAPANYPCKLRRVGFRDEATASTTCFNELGWCLN